MKAKYTAAGITQPVIPLTPALSPDGRGRKKLPPAQLRGEGERSFPQLNAMSESIATGAAGAAPSGSLSPGGEGWGEGGLLT